MQYQWVLKSVVLAIHQQQLAEHGGDAGVRDEGLIESALARPRNLLVYGDPAPGITALVGSYAYGISRNHLFLDGNKRVGYVVARTFLKLNGYDIKTTNEDKVLTMLAVASSRRGKAELANWFRQQLVKK